MDYLRTPYRPTLNDIRRRTVELSVRAFGYGDGGNIVEELSNPNALVSKWVATLCSSKILQLRSG